MLLLLSLLLHSSSMAAEPAKLAAWSADGGEWDSGVLNGVTYIDSIKHLNVSYDRCKAMALMDPIEVKVEGPSKLKIHMRMAKEDGGSQDAAVLIWNPDNAKMCEASTKLIGGGKTYWIEAEKAGTWFILAGDRAYGMKVGDDMRRHERTLSVQITDYSAPPTFAASTPKIELADGQVRFASAFGERAIGELERFEGGNVCGTSTHSGHSERFLILNEPTTLSFEARGDVGVDRLAVFPEGQRDPICWKRGDDVKLPAGRNALVVLEPNNGGRGGDGTVYGLWMRAAGAAPFAPGSYADLAVEGVKVDQVKVNSLRYAPVDFTTLGPNESFAMMADAPTGALLFTTKELQVAEGATIGAAEPVLVIDHQRFVSADGMNYPLNKQTLSALTTKAPATVVLPQEPRNYGEGDSSIENVKVMSVALAKPDALATYRTYDAKASACFTKASTTHSAATSGVISAAQRSAADAALRKANAPCVANQKRATGELARVYSALASEYKALLTEGIAKTNAALTSKLGSK